MKKKRLLRIPGGRASKKSAIASIIISIPGILAAVFILSSAIKTLNIAGAGGTEAKVTALFGMLLTVFVSPAAILFGVLALVISILSIKSYRKKKEKGAPHSFTGFVIATVALVLSALSLLATVVSMFIVFTLLFG